MNLTEARLMYERNLERQPNTLQEWFEAKIREAVRAGEDRLVITNTDIPEQFVHESLGDTLSTINLNGFTTSYDGLYAKISGWTE